MVVVAALAVVGFSKVDAAQATATTLAGATVQLLRLVGSPPTTARLCCLFERRRRRGLTKLAAGSFVQVRWLHLAMRARSSLVE